MSTTDLTAGPAALERSEVADARDRHLETALRRSRRAGVVISERWLFTLGAALAVGGLSLVVVGWIGTSQTVLVAGQIPYVVSGGLLGLGFVFLGGFLYFGYWLAVLVRESGERGDRDRADLERLGTGLEEANRSLAMIAGLLDSGALAPAGGRARKAATASASSATVSTRVAPTLVATASGSMAHRPDCAIVAHRDDLQPVAGDLGNLRLCRICNPQT